MSIGNLKDSGNQGNNFPWQLKVLQGLQAIFDEAAQPLTCVEDSVTICPPAGGLDVNLHDGAGTPITSTPDALGNTGIDVNIIGGVSIEVNLDALDDQVGIYGYTDVNNPNSVKAIKVDTNGAIAIQDNGGSITVDANDLDIRNLTFATDKVDVSGSSVTITDGSGPITVDGTVTSNQGTSPWVVSGSVNIGTMPEVEIKNDSANPIPVNGTVTANAGTGNFTVVQPTASNLNATVVGGTGVSRTPGMLRPNNISGNVNTVAPAGFYSVSVANVGVGNGTVLASLTTIKPGEVLNFSADAINNYFTTFAYDATGTEFLIIYVA